MTLQSEQPTTRMNGEYCDTSTTQLLAKSEGEQDIGSFGLAVRIPGIISLSVL